MELAFALIAMALSAPIFLTSSSAGLLSEE
jgi:hypothetical protein